MWLRNFTLPSTQTALIGIIVVGSIVSSFLAIQRFYIVKDYYVIAKQECDPLMYSCFIGGEDNTPSSYYIIYKKAYLIPPCNGWAGECQPLQCSVADGDGCYIEYCDPDLHDKCSTPSTI